MSGDRFVDTARGPAFEALVAMAKPVTDILLAEGIHPALAGFVAYRCVDAVLAGLDGSVTAAELLTWGSEDFGCGA